MLTEPLSIVAARAEALSTRLADIPALEAAIVDTQGYAGGGALPMQALASRAVALRSRRFSAEALAQRLRAGSTRVLGRIEQDLVLIDLRTVDDGELPALSKAIREAA
jgi:L-seryl-tRNA(Ser) seleniumtransferase